jgi:hypothetical protein
MTPARLRKHAKAWLVGDCGSALTNASRHPHDEIGRVHHD